jgi:hypothetical protein
MIGKAFDTPAGSPSPPRPSQLDLTFPKRLLQREKKSRAAPSQAYDP